MQDKGTIRNAGEGKTGGTPAGLSDSISSCASCLALADSIPDILFCTDANGRIYLANKAFEAFTGIPMGTASGKVIDECLPESLGAQWRKNAGEVCKKSLTIRTEVSCPGKDGWDLVFEVMMAPLTDDLGKSSGIITVCKDISERRRISEEYKSLSNFFEKVIKDIPLAVHVIDTGFRVKVWNRFLEDYTSIKKEEIIGKDLFEVVPGLIAGGWRDIFALVMKTGIPHERRNYRHTLNTGPRKGHTVYQKIRIEPLFEGSLVTGCLTILEDVTNEVYTESKFKTIIEMAMDGFMAIAPDGGIIDANDAATSLLGWSKAELLTMSVKNIETLETPEAIAEHLRKVREAGSDRFETIHRKKDGAMVDVEVSVTYMELDGGLYFSFIRDITEKKKTIFAKQEEQRRFSHEMAESLPGTFYVFDEQGAMKDWNTRLEEATGYLPAEIARMKAIDLVAEDERDLISTKIREVFEKGYASSEGSLLTKDKKKIPYFFTGHRSVIEGTTVLVGMGLDISQQKQMEADLIKTQKLESLGILAGGIAHDFNNTLTAVIGNISLAKESLGRETGAFKRLDDAEKASWKAQGLTRQLLTFAKGGEPFKKPLYLDRLVRDAAELATRGSSIRCEFHFSDDLRPVEADESQISQVINNIVLNSVQAMPSGGAIGISARNIDLAEGDRAAVKPGPYVVIEIIDSGCGIPENIIDKIYDPYFTTKQAGSGLGLATAHSIIKRHGGMISVSSTPGSGTAFSILLPATESMPETRKKTAKKAVKTGERILIMDDEEIIRDVAGDMLRYLGYAVETSSDGKEMLEKYMGAKMAGEPFALVIMDLTIPGGMGGKEAIGRLLEADPCAKAIVSSGYSTDPVISDYTGHGFKGAVAKPYRVAELGEEVGRVIQLKD